jgi:hypothetical protein
MESVNNINWRRLMSAMVFYNVEGFKYIDLDWTIPSNISEITKPEISKDVFIDGKALVGSAEQSFLDMFINRNLEKGRYCGITPCFRDDIVDEIHNKYFIKVELIDTLNVNIESLMDIINKCKRFFGMHCKPQVVEVKNEYKNKCNDSNTYDIIDSKSGIELGSYGIREYNGFKWIFATGLAEPRLSKVLKLNNG